MRTVEFTCNHCGNHIKTDGSGGRRPTVVHAMYEVPATLFVVTNNKGEVFDFCSRDCLEFGDFE